jgi:hypothetical protein
MNFAVGDEVVYTCNLPDLPDPWLRPRDWGRVVYVRNDYVCWRAYCDSRFDEMRRCLPDSMSHSPRSPKYYRQKYNSVVGAIEDGFLRRTKRIVLRDAVLVALEKEHDWIMNSETEPLLSF